MATIKDIAKKSGYSIGTVSRVINNRSDVSQEARTRIENTIKELDFRPNENAKLLKQAVPSGISVIVRGMDNRFLTSILEKIQARLAEHGEGVGVRFLHETEDEVLAAAELARRYKLKGFIFLGGSSLSFRKSFEQVKLPSVLVTASASALGFDNLSSFTTDDYAAAGFAVEQLIAKGHKHIGIIGGLPVDHDDDNTARRIAGAIDAMKRAGIEADAGHNWIPCLFSMEAGYEAAGKLLEQYPEVTAVFALSDMVAYGVIRAFFDRGFNVPDDFSVISFDGVESTNYSIPRLSTVRQDVDQLAEKSVDDLLLRISYGRNATHATVPFSFVVGESIAPPRDKDN